MHAAFCWKEASVGILYMLGLSYDMASVADPVTLPVVIMMCMLPRRPPNGCCQPNDLQAIDDVDSQELASAVVKCRRAASDDVPSINPTPRMVTEYPGRGRIFECFATR